MLRHGDGMNFSVSRFGFVLLVSLPAGSALAADFGAAPYPAPAAIAPARLYDIVMEVGFGGAYSPSYEGAKDYDISPTGFVTLHQLWLPGFGTIKDGRRTVEGWSFGPSFRYLSARDSNDHAALYGLNDVDAAFELGVKVAYTYGGWLRPSLALRHGFGGHDGIVGEAAIDALFFPTPETEFTIGPRVSFANGAYMSTYFGITPGESSNSGLPVYDAGSGFKGVGLEASGKYRFTEQWAVFSSLAYEKLVGDAAASPIVKDGGSADQFTGKLGLTYTFGMKVFDQ
jgi:outer membrane protein